MGKSIGRGVGGEETRERGKGGEKREDRRSGRKEAQKKGGKKKRKKREEEVLRGGRLPLHFSSRFRPVRLSTAMLMEASTTISADTATIAELVSNEGVVVWIEVTTRSSWCSLFL